MMYRETMCKVCEHFWYVKKDARQVYCPKCLDGMKDNGESYCICAHKQKMHTRPETGGCWECGCMDFENIIGHTPTEDEARLLKMKTCKHEYKKVEPKEGESMRYKCIYCGGCTVNTKPEGWIED